MKGNSWMKWNTYYGEFQENLHLKWPVLNFILVPSYLSHLFGSLAFYAASLHTPFVKHKYKIHCPGWIYWPVWSPLNRKVHVWANSFVTAVSGWDLQWSLGIQPAPLPERWGFLQPKCRTQEELQPCLGYQSQVAAGSVVTEKVTLVLVSVSGSPLHYPKAKVQTGIWVKRNLLQHGVSTTSLSNLCHQTLRGCLWHKLYFTLLRIPVESHYAY